MLVPVSWVVLVALFRVPLTAVAWLLREPKDFGAIVVPGLTSIAPGITDTTIAITAAVLLFVIHGRETAGGSRPLLVWSEARRIPCEVLLITGATLANFVFG